MSERRRPIPLRRQARLTIPLAATWTFGIVALTVAATQDVVPVEQLFLDPAAVNGAPWYTGLLSNAGILAWTVAAVSAGGGAWVALRAGRPSAFTFLGTGALVTSVLLLDDLLQAHAVLLPSIGVNPTVAQFLIVAPAPLWIWLHRQEVVRSRWMLLAAAFAGFGASLVVDFGAPGATSSILVEDGGKFLGVLAWAQYFVLTAGDIGRSVINAALGRGDRSWTLDDEDISLLT